MLKRMRGYNKLIILITDGYPNYSKNGTSIPGSVYNQQCKKSLQKVLKITPNVICFLVGPEHSGVFWSTQSTRGRSGVGLEGWQPKTMETCA